jgi:micrococcal nuclease
MKRRTLAILAAGTAIAGGTALWDRTDMTPREFAPGQCHAVDGDTIDCGGRRVRLVNIDAPELHGQCPAEIQAAERAKLAALIAMETAVVRVTPEKARDKYGRTLARVAINGRDLGETLIAQNLARPYTGGQRKGWCPAG